MDLRNDNDQAPLTNEALKKFTDSFASSGCNSAILPLLIKLYSKKQDHPTKEKEPVNENELVVIHVDCIHVFF